MSKSERNNGLIIVIVLTVLILVPIIVISLNNKPMSDLQSNSTNDATQKPVVDVNKINIDRLATQRNDVIVDVLKAGTGKDVAESGDTISVAYVGMLTDGTEFDNSYDRGMPYEFTLGMGSVIKGWDVGLQGAKVGEERLLLIPSEFGYGSRGSGPIPPDADLVFHTKIVSIKKAN